MQDQIQTVVFHTSAVSPAMPRPTSGCMANALATHDVMVSGNVYCIDIDDVVSSALQIFTGCELSWPC